MKISLSRLGCPQPSLCHSGSASSSISGSWDLALPRFLTSLSTGATSSAPHIPGVAPHRVENPFPQPARHICSQFKVWHICMGVLRLLLDQAEPKSQGRSQLMLHAIVRGTCLRFCIWEAPGLNLKTKSVLMQALVPKEAHSEQMPG